MAEFPTNFAYPKHKRKLGEGDAFRAATESMYHAKKEHKGKGKNTLSEISPFREKKEKKVLVKV